MVDYIYLKMWKTKPWMERGATIYLRSFGNIDNAYDTMLYEKEQYQTIYTLASELYQEMSVRT